MRETKIVDFLSKIKKDKTIYLDIETVPFVTYEELCTNPAHAEAKQLWDKRTLLRLKKGDIEEGLTEKEIWESAALYPEYNKVICICIGFLLNGNYTEREYVNDNEEELIIDFLYAITYLQQSKNKFETIIGANIDGFDLPVLFRKAIIYGYSPTSLISEYDRKPWDDKNCDITKVWRRGSFNGDATIASICRMLKLSSPKTDEIDGSKVYEFYLNGEIDKIAKYCRSDVRALYDIVNYLSNLKVFVI